jgi:hypothetical protein
MPLLAGAAMIPVGLLLGPSALRDAYLPTLALTLGFVVLTLCVYLSIAWAAMRDDARDLGSMVRSLFRRTTG